MGLDDLLALVKGLSGRVVAGGASIAKRQPGSKVYQQPWLYGIHAAT